jgi:hypothetical protein
VPSTFEPFGMGAMTLSIPENSNQCERNIAVNSGGVSTDCVGGFKERK